MNTKLLLAYLVCLSAVMADTAEVLASISLLGRGSIEAYEGAQQKIFPGALVQAGPKSRHFSLERQGKPIYFFMGEDGKGRIMSVSWLFGGEKWPRKTLLEMHREFSNELAKQGWKIVSTAASVDNQQLFGQSVSIPRGANTVNLGITFRRASPLAEITLVLGLPMDGAADDFVPALSIELENNPQ